MLKMAGVLGFNRFMRSQLSSHLSIVLLATFSAAPFALAKERPKTLLESIQMAIDDNPKTKSTNETLKAARYSVLALTQEAYWPSGSLYCTTDYSVTRSGTNGAQPSASQSRTNSCGLSGSFNIFDSGEARFRIESARKRLAALDATFNTTDSFIENTRGALAQKTKEIFIMYTDYRENKEFLEFNLKALQTVNKINSDNIITAKISDSQASISEFENMIGIMAAEFENSVKQPPAEDMQDFSGAIKDLVIPKKLSDAIEIALAEGPDVRRRTLNVEMARFDVKATKAHYGPRLDLNADVGFGRYRYYSQDYDDRVRDQNAYVGLTLSVPLMPGRNNRIRAAEAQLRAAELEREEDINTVRHSLTVTYQNIENTQRQYLEQKENFELQLKYVMDILNQIEVGDLKSIDANDFIQAIDTLAARHRNMLYKQSVLIRDRFNIQQVLGMLFEQTPGEGSAKGAVYGPVM